MDNYNFSILKLKNEDKSLTFRVKPEWNENSFKIIVFLEDSTAWQANVSPEELEKLAAERSQNVDEYYSTIKQYFIQSESNICFELKLSDKNTANFTIKRKVSGRTILYFTTKLIQIDFQNSLFDLLDELLSKHSLLQEDLENVKRKVRELDEDKKLCQNKLTEFVNLKTNWEREMYSNFVIVLNEKKKRIKFLTDLLSRKKINLDEIQETMEVNAATSDSSSKPKRKLETISDSESNSEYETDKKDNVSDIEADIEMEPTPSTSKQSFHIDEDSPPPVLSLPKFSKKGTQKFVPQKLKPVVHNTHQFLTEETQSTEDITQEPYLSTQEWIDRM